MAYVPITSKRPPPCLHLQESVVQCIILEGRVRHSEHHQEFKEDVNLQGSDNLLEKVQLTAK